MFDYMDDFTRNIVQSIPPAEIVNIINGNTTAVTLFPYLSNPKFWNDLFLFHYGCKPFDSRFAKEHFELEYYHREVNSEISVQNFETALSFSTKAFVKFPLHAHILNIKIYQAWIDQTEDNATEITLLQNALDQITELQTIKNDRQALEFFEKSGWKKIIGDLDNFLSGLEDIFLERLTEINNNARFN